MLVWVVASQVRDGPLGEVFLCDLFEVGEGVGTVFVRWPGKGGVEVAASRGCVHATLGRTRGTCGLKRAPVNYIVIRRSGVVTHNCGQQGASGGPLTRTRITTVGGTDGGLNS